MAKQGQMIAENEQARYGSHVDLGRRNLEQQEARDRYVQSQPQSVVDIRNRLVVFSSNDSITYYEIEMLSRCDTQ